MFNFLLRLFQLGLSLTALALGVHGMWVYINRASIPHGIENVKFILMFDVPSAIRWLAQPILQWMTSMSLENWYAPAIALFLGIMIKLNLEREHGHPRDTTDKTEGNLISYRSTNSLMPPSSQEYDLDEEE